MSKEEYNPKILGFLCNWCCYAAADAAGVSRYQYPTNLRTIRVMCTGRIDPAFVLRGLVEGADGIFTGGWQLGECHYQVGNYDAMGMNSLVHKVLTGIGVKEERFALQWASAAEAPRFVKLITEFTGKIKELGPLGEAEGIEPEEMKKRLDTALGAVSDRKVRMFFGTATKSIRKEGIFTQEYISSVIDEKLTKTVTAALNPAPAEEKPATEKKAEKKAAKSAPIKEEKPKKLIAKKTAKKDTKAKKAAPAKKKPAPAKKAAAPKKKTAPAKKKAAPKKATATKKKK